MFIRYNESIVKNSPTTKYNLGILNVKVSVLSGSGNRTGDGMSKYLPFPAATLLQKKKDPCFS